MWVIVKDMGNWANWDRKARYRVVEHQIIEENGNVVTCEEKEQFLFPLLRFSHRDTYMLDPVNYSIRENIDKGDFSGNFKMILTEHPEEIHVLIKANIVPTKLWMKILGLFGGDYLLHTFWDKLLVQLKNKAENTAPAS